MLSLAEARNRILSEAVPSEAIETSLSEAIGLVLAEPLISDVDLPPFDRAAQDGYAVRAIDTIKDARLKVVGLKRGGKPRKTAEIQLNRGEAARVQAGDPMPVGADSVLRTEESRPEPGTGPPREVVVLRAVEVGQGVVPRGYYLRAGATLATPGTRIRPAMISLLASEGCVHPICYRRVRVAVLAVGDHLVGPAEAPVMHRERNASGPTVVIPCLQWGATAHDLGVVSESELPAALDRALTARIVVILGESEGAIPKAMKRAGIETIFEGVSLHPGKRLTYGVVRDRRGQAVQHVFVMATGPIGVLSGVALLIGPLIQRLQGGPHPPAPPLNAIWTGAPHRPTDDRVWAVPARLAIDPEGRLRVSAIEHRGKDDLPGFAQAEALALLPPRTGPWLEGEIVEVVPLGAWPG